jgi:putative heme iron utilization protein
VLADAVLTDDADVIARYGEYFPESRGYHETHDFAFYRLEPVRARYIGGFGRIHWVAPDLLPLANPFDAAQEAAICSHMNADHLAALLHYSALCGLTLPAGTQPIMAGIDAEGMHLRIGARILRVEFPRPISSPAEARTLLIELAHAPLARTA